MIELGNNWLQISITRKDGLRKDMHVNRAMVEDALFIGDILRLACQEVLDGKPGDTADGSGQLPGQGRTVGFPLATDQESHPVEE